MLNTTPTHEENAPSGSAVLRASEQEVAHSNFSLDTNVLDTFGVSTLEGVGDGSASEASLNAIHQPSTGSRHSSLRSSIRLSSIPSEARGERSEHYASLVSDDLQLFGESLGLASLAGLRFAPPSIRTKEKE